MERQIKNIRDGLELIMKNSTRYNPRITHREGAACASLLIVEVEQFPKDSEPHQILRSLGWEYLIYDYPKDHFQGYRFELVG